MHVDQRAMLEALERVGRKDQRSDLPMFSGKLNLEECMDSIVELDIHFECNNVPKIQRVKVAKSKMKGSALSWWNFLQNERIEEEKEPIATWKRMKSEVKKQFIPEDYEVLMHQKLQSVRQKDLHVGAYTKEFHKLTLRAQVLENEKQKLARYLNGLKYSIKDEVVLFNPKSVHQCYQMTLKIEEKIKRKNDSHGRGKGGNNRSGGRFGGRGSLNRSQGEPSCNQEK